MARGKKQIGSLMGERPLSDYLPKGDERKMGDIDIIDAGRLGRVRESKLMAPYRPTGNGDRGEGPTPERVGRAGDHSKRVIDNDGNKIVSMRDSPLDRMLSRGAIDPAPYRALMKYKHHWYHAGLSGSLSSVDANRVFASDATNFSGMARTERQAEHRQQYRKAVQKIGVIASNVVERVVCYEMPMAAGVETARNAPQATSESAMALKIAGDLLADYWGIT